MKMTNAKTVVGLKRDDIADAKKQLSEVGLYKGDHYEITSVRSGGRILQAIRSINDDLEVLGDIAKQLVIAEISFKLITR